MLDCVTSSGEMIINYYCIVLCVTSCRLNLEILALRYGIHRFRQHCNTFAVAPFSPIKEKINFLAILIVEIQFTRVNEFFCFYFLNSNNLMKIGISGLVTLEHSSQMLINDICNRHLLSQQQTVTENCCRFIFI